MGLFITFEGIEGSGKTTQVTLAGEYLDGRNVSFLVTSEPGGCDLGKELRRLLLESASPWISERAELFLFAADRAQHVEEIILPALKEKAIVLCDRYCDATIAYQGYGRGLDLEVINIVNNYAARSLKPDYTILLDVHPERGLERVRSRSSAKEKNDRFEGEQLEFHRRVREGYLSRAKAEPRRFHIINADADVDAVFEQVKSILSEILGS